MLTKTIGLVIRDYKISMTSPLKFYEDDDLELYFEIDELGVTVIDEEGNENEVVTPLFPEQAFLFIETSRKIDSIESVSIDGNKICFRITDKYTQLLNVGIGRMQIVLLDGASRKALPPFEFEVQPVIYHPVTYDGLTQERGVPLLTERGMLLESTDDVYGIKISSLPYTEELIGAIPITQYGETKQVDITIMSDLIIQQANDNADELINERIQETVDGDISLLIDTKINDAIGSGNIEEMINEKINEELSYVNPASPTITDFKSALDYLLYYNLTISFSCNVNRTLEIGSTVNSVNFNWSYNKNIVSQSFNGVSIDKNVRTYTYNTPFSSNKTFTLSATDERKSFSSSIAFNFNYGRYWGVSTATTLDNAMILAMNKELSTGRGKNFTINANENEYIYYCYPMSWGVATFSVGGFAGGFELVDNISFTNNQGHTSTYYVYRSTNHSLGNTSVIVS